MTNPNQRPGFASGFEDAGGKFISDAIGTKPLADEDIHDAQVTVADTAIRERWSKTELIDILEMLGLESK